MQRNKYIVSVCVFVLLLLILVGCSDSEKSGSNIKTLGFKSYKLGSFENLNTVLGVTKYEDVMFVFGEEEGGIICEYSSTDGITWNKAEVLTDVVTGNKNAQLQFVDLDENGGLIVGYEIIGSDGSIESCNIWKEENGETVELNSTNISKMFCNNDQGFIYDGEDIIVYKNGFTEELFTIKASNMVDFCASENEIFVLDENEINIYSVENGERIETDSIFTDLYRDEIKRTKDRVGADALSCRQVMKYISKDKLCFALENGLYTYDLLEKQIECLLDNTDNEYKAMSDVIYGYVAGSEVTSQGIVMICLSDGEKKSVLYSDKQVNFENAEDNSQQQQEQSEITLYSLYYSECIEMMIDIFKNNNPDITINYTWGIDSNSGISVSDAISSLNTQLLAGEGPDVIVMDGLNVRSYENSGNLLELSDVVLEIQESEPSCLTEILSAYKTDNCVYAIPSKVQFTTLVGPADDIEKINNIDDLIEYIESCDKPNFGNDLNFYEWEAVFDVLYPIYSSEIIDSEGNYDEDMLKEFLVKLKELYDLEMNRTTKDEIMSWKNENGEYAQVNSITSSCMKPLYNREYSGQRIAFVTMEKTAGLWKYYSIKHSILIGSNAENTANQDYTYRIWANDGANLYIPSLIYSINANSKEIEAAKRFVIYMFSTDIQKQYYSDSMHLKQGNPINMDAIKKWNDEMLQMGTPGGVEEVGGNEYLFSSYFTSDDDMNEYIEALKSLELPVNVDATVEEIIKEQMPDYLNGNSGVDDTYNTINNLLNVYQSE